MSDAIPSDITCRQLKVNVCNRCSTYSLSQSRCWVPIYKDQILHCADIRTAFIAMSKLNNIYVWPRHSFYHFRIAVKLYYPNFLETFDKLSVLL